MATTLATGSGEDTSLAMPLVSNLRFSGEPKSFYLLYVSLIPASGYSCAFTAFVNSHFLGSAQGTSHSQQGVDILNQTFTFSADQLRDGDNGEPLSLLISSCVRLAE